ncbi:MAG TPA: DsbE family thiol:disulfide interchange protein [Burkholderiaceae bacterium]|nr:DsbE family thiol:disulfide interchange protein [Burkholderiaceae bacterium]HQR70499.1 DsbE family thiol:disulfide interchange protein [Burkholderiaceae bacterium]
MRKALVYLLPLGVFLVVSVFLLRGLWLNPREVPSPFIDKAAPMFSLPQLGQPEAKFSPADMKGQVWLLNVWASWCVACRQEHPLLVELSRKKAVPIIGLNYKDKPEAAAGWLAQWGNPYDLSVKDADGRIGIEYGVYGVPETFVIDKTGVIRFKQIGPITEEVWQTKLLPLLEQLRKA